MLNLKKATPHIFLTIFALLAIVLALGTLSLTGCDSDSEEDSGNIVINFSDGNTSRAAMPWPPTDYPGMLAQMEYRVILAKGQQGQGNTEVYNAKGVTTIHIAASPGLWTVYVEAYYQGALYATGSNTVNVHPNQNNSVVVKMNKAFADDDITVTVSPVEATVARGYTRQFSATVTGTDNTAVTWNVSGGNGSSSISATGLLAVGETEAVNTVLTVSAASSADPAKSGSAAVTVSGEDLPDPIYGITLSQTGTHTFPSATQGYGTQSGLSVTVTNTGNQATGTLSIGLSGENSSAFTLSPSSIGSIAVSDSATFTVSPNTGLGAGTYDATVTVTGGNGITAGFSVSFTVNAANTPSAPQNLTATPGDGLVTLSWTAPSSDGGSAITRYEVSSDNGVTWVTASSNTGHTFTGLTNGTTYSFQVRAVNVAGNGEAASASATPIDPGTVPPVPVVPTAPQNFTATPGNGQVVLSWTAPASDGGSAITGYQVSSDNGSTWVTASSNTGHIFTGLDGDTTYYFQVRAVNAAGSGEAASASATTPTSTPEDRFVYYWVDEHGGLVTTGATTVKAGATLTISASDTSYIVKEWHLNGEVETGQTGITYVFSSIILGNHTIGLFVEKDDKLYNTNITITVEQ